MRLDFVNPASLMPTQQADAGVVAQQNTPQPLSNVVPAFRMPDDGSRPEDKEQDNKDSYAQLNEEINEENGEQALPEIFKLAAQPQFRELLQFYLGVDEGQLWVKMHKARLLNEVEHMRPYSGMFTQKSDSQEVRSNTYGKTLFYHYAMPGKRFKGQM